MANQVEGRTGGRSPERPGRSEFLSRRAAYTLLRDEDLRAMSRQVLHERRRARRWVRLPRSRLHCPACRTSWGLRREAKLQGEALYSCEECGGLYRRYGHQFGVSAIACPRCGVERAAVVSGTRSLRLALFRSDLKAPTCTCRECGFSNTGT